MTRQGLAVVALSLSFALAGCQPPAARGPAPTAAAAPVTASRAAVGAVAARPAPARDAQLQPMPTTRTPAFVATSGTASLAVTAQFNKLSDPDFANSAAAYHLLAVMPAGKALLTLSTLDENLLTRDDVVLDGATDAAGKFTFAGNFPGDRPYVVGAHFVRGHRMSALVPAGATAVTIDEGSSMVAEMARWQLAPILRAADPDLTDLTAVDHATLTGATHTLLPLVELASGGGSAPNVDALKVGAGHLLRNLYVAAFGSRVTPVGQTSTPPEANTLSDTWERLLGFKPLALTRVAGNGIRDFNQGDGLEATAASLIDPTDAVSDAAGNLYIAEFNGNTIRYIPKTNQAGPFLGESDTQLAAGKLYTIAGQVNGPKTGGDYDTLYNADSVASPDLAPAMAGGYPVFTPNKLCLEPAGGASHVYFSSMLGGRVMLMPTADVHHFGRDFKAGLLYTVAGAGSFDPNAETVVADGLGATAGKLYNPTALARDAAGNLWILDAGTGEIRVVRESDGLIFTLPMTMTGNPFTAPGAKDMRLNPAGTMLYVADTKRHFIFRVSLPDAPTLAAAVDAAAGLPATGIARVMGNPGKAGFLDTAIASVKFPDIHDISDGVDEMIPLGADAGKIAVLLNAPSSLDFDAAGDIVVADGGGKRLRLLRDSKAYTIAGGLDTRFLAGDSRLAYLPGTSAVRFGADGNLLVADRTESIVRRLWTTRGTLVKP